MVRKFFKNLRLDGCVFVVATCAVTCVLLAVNIAIVSSLVNPFIPTSGRFAADRAKLWQIVRFVCPVLLIFVEWTLIEYGLGRLRRWWRGKGS
jgi:hypothetical protein